MLIREEWNVKEKQWGKQSYLASSREDIIEAHTILAYFFTDSLFSLCSSLQSTDDVLIPKLCANYSMSTMHLENDHYDILGVKIISNE